MHQKLRYLRLPSLARHPVWICIYMQIHIHEHIYLMFLWDKISFLIKFLHMAKYRFSSYTKNGVLLSRNAHAICNCIDGKCVASATVNWIHSEFTADRSCRDTPTRCEATHTRSYVPIIQMHPRTRCTCCIPDADACSRRRIISNMPLYITSTEKKFLPLVIIFEQLLLSSSFFFFFLFFSTVFPFLKIRRK